MEFVVHAYEETTDLMLPYPELPVAVISGMKIVHNTSRPYSTCRT